MKCKDRPSKD